MYVLSTPPDVRPILHCWCTKRLVPVPHSRPLHVSFLPSSRSGRLLQHLVTSALATLAFSLSVSTTISDVTILEFIFWTMNLIKHTNFIRLHILKRYIELENRNYIIDLKRKLQNDLKPWGVFIWWWGTKFGIFRIFFRFLEP
jgi:hypothetical protein